MPCYTVQYTSVELKAANRDILIQALKTLGYQFSENKDSVTVSTPQGTITISNDKARFKESSALQNNVNKIKQAYSRAAIQHVAKKYNFKLTDKGSNQIVIRRY